MSRQVYENERRKPVWPANKPMPTFKSIDAEIRWWHKYEHEADSLNIGWKPIVGPKPPRATLAGAKRRSRR